MKVNIYYGGRGLVDDPTKMVLEKMQKIFDELRIKTERYNLFELKNNITTLPQTMKDADGVILATTIEWMGIGGYMQQFLDACWLYGDKKKISEIYMFPVVMSQTYGERDGAYTLQRSWDMLGGKVCDGLSAYVDDTLEFEMNEEYVAVIENKVEDIYRTISKKLVTLPTSTNEIKQTVMKGPLELTPQESEQLSKYVADDEYVKKQKEDIEELSSMFINMISSDPEEKNIDSYINVLKSKAVGMEGVSAEYSFILSDFGEGIDVKVLGKSVAIEKGDNENADVVGKLSSDTLDNIVSSKQTFQKAFMSGEMSAKGNFKTLRMLDQIFEF